MRTRNSRVKYRLTDKEFDRLKKKVSKSGLSRQAYMLKLITDVVPNDLPQPDYGVFAEKFREIGIKINEVAYLANATGMIDEEKYDENMKLFIEKIEELLIEIHVWLEKDNRNSIDKEEMDGEK